MNLFEKESMNIHKATHSSVEAVKAYYKMTEEQRKISTDLKHEIYHHVDVCNAIAEKIGFQSLTKDFSNLDTPYDWLLIVLSQEVK